MKSPHRSPPPPANGSTVPRPKERKNTKKKKKIYNKKIREKLTRNHSWAHATTVATI